MWTAGNVHFTNIPSEIPSDYFNSILWACLSIWKRTARTANNPIEKLAGPPLLSSALMNNSAVRAKAGRGDLVTADWLSTGLRVTLWALHPVPSVTGCGATRLPCWWPRDRPRAEKIQTRKGSVDQIYSSSSSGSCNGSADHHSLLAEVCLTLVRDNNDAHDPSN